MANDEVRHSKNALDLVEFQRLYGLLKLRPHATYIQPGKPQQNALESFIDQATPLVSDQFTMLVSLPLSETSSSAARVAQSAHPAHVPRRWSGWRTPLSR